MKRQATTVYDIAKVVGMSPSTVSRALNNSGYVSTETRQRILKAAQDMNYQPNRVARSLRTQQTNLLAFGIPNTSDPFFSELIAIMQPNLEQHDYDLLVYATGGVREKEERLLSLAEQGQVDGVFMVPQSFNERDFVEIAAKRLPCVIFDARSPISVDTVASDDRLGAAEAVKYLIQLGHRRIGFLGYQVNAIEERLRGYKDALTEQGIAVSPSWIRICDELNDIDGLINDTLEDLVAVTAFFCVADIVGVKLIMKAQEKGINIPDDISVIGFNDDFIAQVVSPKLTTMALESKQLGSRACQVMLERIKNPDIAEYPVQYTKVAPRLIVRGSVREI